VYGKLEGFFSEASLSFVDIFSPILRSFFDFAVRLH
jgi:hypothetical protein